MKIKKVTVDHVRPASSGVATRKIAVSLKAAPWEEESDPSVKPAQKIDEQAARCRSKPGRLGSGR